MLAIQRNIFKKVLRDKYESWKLPETKYFYLKNLKTAPPELAPTFAIERDDNGYFYLSDDLIAYCNLKNGQINRMRKDWAEKDWQCYTELFQAGVFNGEFRIDIPNFRELYNIDGHNWEYAELQSPCQDYGKNSNDDVFEWPELTDGRYQNNNITEEYKDSVAQYHRDFVDHAAIILKQAGQISTKHGVGLPRNLCRPSTRYKDRDGYFWSDFDQDSWIIDNNTAMNYYLAIFYGTLRFARVCGVLDDTRVENVFLYAREKWTIN